MTRTEKRDNERTNRKWIKPTIYGVICETSNKLNHKKQDQIDAKARHKQESRVRDWISVIEKEDRFFGP